MTVTPEASLLRRALLVDAAITGATAVMLVVGAPILQDLHGPERMLRMRRAPRRQKCS